MGLIVPLPFSTAFFKLFKRSRREVVTIGEVDPAFVLESVEGLEGQPFVYPGTDVEMVKGGANMFLTAENFEEYRGLIEKFTCGSALDPIVKEFARGLHCVYQPGSWNILSAEEARHLVCGDDTADLTMAELLQSIEPSNGYTLKSAHILMLIEVILEMGPRHRALFFKFVTGAERLPIGGIAKLHPRLTVARKAEQDQSLPSAMTCKNYFKLPPYETKEEMRAKLILAIEDGQGAFLLT
jgi:E3 ubiquitin-protein ligase TRIP12